MCSQEALSLLNLGEENTNSFHLVKRELGFPFELVIRAELHFIQRKRETGGVDFPHRPGYALHWANVGDVTDQYGLIFNRGIDKKNAGVAWKSGVRRMMAPDAGSMDSSPLNAGRICLGRRLSSSQSTA
jgi:hypothetical protein